MGMATTGLFLVLILALFRTATPKEQQECRSESLLGMQTGRIKDNQIDASSYTSAERAPSQARLYHDSAWQAFNSDYFQYLEIDLGERHLITRVQTQGLRGSGQYVQQFYLLYSTDKVTWIYVTDENNEPMLLDANTDDNTIANVFLAKPIVARYVRFSPQRWRNMISMRVELFGCTYEAFSASFTNGFIRYDLSSSDQYFVQSNTDFLRLRFLTNKPNGIMFYAGGKQGDYFALELKMGRLFLSIRVGLKGEYGSGDLELEGGSLLDNNQWHDVLIKRNYRNVSMMVDRVASIGIIYGDFFRLDIDRDVFLGGVPYFAQSGLTIRQNFEGCMENVELNEMDIIRDSKHQLFPETDRDKLIDRFSTEGGVSYSCTPRKISPITFPTDDAFIKLSRPNQESLSASLDFRTFNPQGLIFRNDLQEGGGFVAVRLDPSCYIEYELSKGSSNLYAISDVIRNSDNGGSYCDGLWHSVILQIDTNVINLTVNGHQMITTRRLSVKSGSLFFIAGGKSEEYGFIGCMKNIILNGQPEDLSNMLVGTNFGGLNGTCAIRDRCHPNPCEHDGVCSQDWNTFTCDCRNNGYAGAICHISAYENSCEAVKELDIKLEETPATIDLDGSGPIDPFNVTCKFFRGDSTKSTETWVGHSHMKKTRVDGYQVPGAYRQQLRYAGNLTVMDAFVGRSTECYQEVTYECRDAKLLQKPTGSYATTYESWGWWIGRSNQPMYYWGNSAQGTHKCECALSVPSTCEGNSKTCNCDAGVTDRELSDTGIIRNKDHLPVIEVRFGDTGTATDERYATYTIGALVCSGDTIIEQAVTFRKADATINLPPYTAATSGDIRFEFKTKSTTGVFFQNTGAVHFIEVRLVESYTIEFRFNVGSGIQVLQARVSYPLNNNKWHVVHVERNRKQSTLIVDKQSPLSLEEPQDQGFRFLRLTSPLVVGASVDYQDGFVGCIRSFQVNGIFQDLHGMVSRGEVTYGVSPGCIGKCDSSPCLNGGGCIEHYSHYVCDCAYSPWRGIICGREVGANFQHGQFVRYEFSSGSGQIGTNNENITVGFLTKDKRGILMQITNADNSEHLSLEVNNEGNLLFAFQVNSKVRWQVSSDIPGVELANGQQHIARVRRSNNGQTVTIKVDDYPEKVQTFDFGTGGDTSLDQPKYIYMGRNASITPDKGFRGCLFRAIFDNLYPLKDAFRDPRPPTISFGNAQEFPLVEDMCGYEEIMHPPDEIEIRPTLIPPPTIDPEKTGQTGESVGLSATSGAVLGAVIAIVVVVLVLLALLIWRYMRSRRGDYKTTEVLNGGQVAMGGASATQEERKKKEWYI